MLGFLLTLTACPVPAPPGDERMGQYALTATSVEREACELEEIARDGGGYDFTFEAVLTRDSTSDAAYVTLNGYSREGTWDGQVLTAEASASRVFVDCSDCATKLVETISVAVLSRSQNEALQGQCPPNPLDGGVPAPNDAGVTGPGLAAAGFDAVRLCGELVTRVVAEGTQDGGACDPRCSGCTARYQLRGDRR